MRFLSHWATSEADKTIKALKAEVSKWREAARALGAVESRLTGQIDHQNTVLQDKAAELEDLRRQLDVAQHNVEEEYRLVQMAGHLRAQAEEQRDVAVARASLLENNTAAQLLDDLAHRNTTIERLEQQADRYRVEISQLESQVAGRAMARLGVRS